MLPIDVIKILNWFWGDIFGQEIANLHDSCSYTLLAATVLYDSYVSSYHKSMMFVHVNIL